MEKEKLVRFKTMILFEQFKETAFKNAESLKTKVGELASAIDFKELYAMIVNYQISRYSTQLHKHEEQGLDYEHTSFKRIANNEMFNIRIGVR